MSTLAELSIRSESLDTQKREIKKVFDKFKNALSQKVSTNKLKYALRALGFEPKRLDILDIVIA